MCIRDRKWTNQDLEDLDLEEEERAFVKHKAPVRQETPVPVSSAPVKEQIPEKAAPFKEEDQDDDFEFIDLDL